MKKFFSILLVAGFLLSGCSGDKDASKDVEDTAKKQEAKENEANKDDKPTYEIVKEEDLKVFKFDELVKSGKATTFHFTEMKYPILKDIEYAGDALKPFLENGKYYFMNASDFHIYDANTMERLMKHKYDYSADLWITDRYSVPIPHGFGNDLQVLDRNTDQVKTIVLGNTKDYSTTTSIASIGVDGDLALFGFQTEKDQSPFHLYAINLATGEKQVVLEDAYESVSDVSDIHIDDKQYYVFDRNHHLFAFDRNTHEQIWKVESTDDFILSRLLTYSDEEYIYGATLKEGKIWRADKQTGEMTILYDSDDYLLIRGVLHVDDGVLIGIGPEIYRLVYVDLHKGKVTKEIQLKGQLNDDKDKTVVFNNHLYMYLTDTDLNNRLLDIPLDNKDNISILDIKSTGWEKTFEIREGNLNIGAGRLLHILYPEND